MFETIIQLLGTAAFIGISILMFNVASNKSLWETQGKSIMTMVASLFVAVAMIRTLPIFGVLSHSNARTANGLMAVLFFVLMLYDKFVRNPAK